MKEYTKRENIIILEAQWRERKNVRAWLKHINASYEECFFIFKSIFYIKTTRENCTLIENAHFAGGRVLAEWPARSEEL